LAGAPAGFSVLCGDDVFLLPVLLMGGAGGITASAHVCTERFAALVAAASDARLAEAREHAEALLPLVQALFAEPSPGVLKGVLRAVGRIGSAAVRMPLSAGSPAAVARALACSESASLSSVSGL
jgi:4-hydroxy-tetrahydrodipicolinate synthase